LYMTDGQEHLFPWADDWPEIRNQRVRVAFANVPRESFVDSAYRRWAERDAPLPIGEGQTISQPFVVALMTQAVDPQPGDKVLEIGTGSGYQTAILCELVRGGHHGCDELVHSVERYASLAEQAVSRLKDLGYTPKLRIDDGAAGWPEAAPFRAIIVTAAAKCLPKNLWDQLDEGGRMAIPIGRRFGEQLLWLIEKSDGRMRRNALGPVRFVPLVSKLLDDPKNCIEFDD
jgi:protein-L-isoaspartate(D-aspartate) O-methyltransferase